jgi:DNA ligase-1
MNTHDLFLLLSALESTPGKTDKLELLKAHQDDPLLKYVVWSAYEPTRNYFIKKIPATKQQGSFTLHPGTWAVLDALADREVTGDAAKRLVKETLEQLESESADIFTRILKRDLRIGVAEKGFHQAFPGLLSKFDVMLASPYQPFEGPRLVSPKIDGMLILAKVDSNLNRVI